ncbi:hypothetical protein E1B28_000717 [Marasmius oreades]|uniref:Uncharacterized protein n=1 Tax=Marasmius oreades TaxID=181124 RepID=A0A9P7V229_9AGAR|nr:uncharacterized protein E1B28_000717 [Marasmius oreades]KAG7098812.1 hypothetical protein E1B28_000717 [Marasmius oreades]
MWPSISSLIPSLNMRVAPYRFPATLPLFHHESRFIHSVHVKVCYTNDDLGCQALAFSIGSNLIRWSRHSLQPRPLVPPKLCWSHVSCSIFKLDGPAQQAIICS